MPRLNFLVVDLNIAASGLYLPFRFRNLAVQYDYYYRSWFSYFLISSFSLSPFLLFSSVSPKCPGADKPITSPTTIFSPTVVDSRGVLRYTRFTDCAWYIQAPPGQRVSLQLTHFQVEKSLLCNDDYLVFVDGRPSPRLPWSYYKQSQEPYGGVYFHQRLCGNDSVLLEKKLFSSANTAGVIFHSDYRTEAPGFRLSVNFTKGKN